MRDDPRDSSEVLCNSCFASLQPVYIRCVECSDVDLCLDCFSRGFEMEGHLKGHDYSVMEKFVDPIFEQGWGAHEELLLLEAMDRNGFANWSKIAEHVVSKSARECERHYTEVYLSTESLMPVAQVINGKKSSPPVPPPKPKARTKARDRLTQAAQRTGNIPAGAGAAVGFLPLRREFSSEFRNTTEQAIAELKFCQDDSLTTRKMKLTAMRVYNQILDERAARKKLIFERGILAQKSKHKTKQIQSDHRVFMRHHSAEEHTKLMESLEIEENLKNRMETLTEYRRNGIRTISDGLAYEEAVKKRAEDDRARRRDVGRAVRPLRARQAIVDHPGRKAPESQAQARYREPPRLGAPLGRREETPSDHRFNAAGVFRGETAPRA
eukprot:628411_1